MLGGTSRHGGSLKLSKEEDGDTDGDAGDTVEEVTERWMEEEDGGAPQPREPFAVPAQCNVVWQREQDELIGLKQDQK